MSPHDSRQDARPAAGPAVARRRPAWLLLPFAVLLLLGFTAELRPDGAHWCGVRGPHCPLGTLLAPEACPGCGLVRSCAAALQGHLGSAVAAHPAGPLAAGLLLGFCLLQAWTLLRGREGRLAAVVRRRAPCWLGVAVLLGWLFRLLAHGLGFTSPLPG